MNARKGQVGHRSVLVAATVVLAMLVVTAVATSIPAVALAANISLERYDEFEGKEIKAVTISGNDVTKEWVITREIRSDVGEEFRHDRMKDDVQRLTNLGIFSSIDVTPTSDGDGVALDYKVRELPWIIPYLKFKFTETDGWSVGPTVSSVNLLGRDIYLTGFVLFGGANTFSVQASWPWIAGDHISADLLWQRLDRENIFYNFEETSNEVTPWIGMYMGDAGRLGGTISYFGVESDIDGRTLSADNTDDLFRIGARLGYDSRDSWQNPSRGFHHELELMKTGGFMGGDGDYLTSNFDVRAYMQTFNRQVVNLGLLTTLQTGTVGTDVPIYMQYNLGGSNSIRGHSVNGLAKNFFGKNQMIATVEYDYLVMPITEYEVLKWAVTFGMEATLFADTGIAWSDGDQFDAKNFKSGFGIGLRALVPAVNVVRLDIGFNLQGGVEFHFGLWPKFEAQRLRIR